MKTLSVILLVSLSMPLSWTSAFSACVKRSLTAGEQAFYDKVIAESEKALPALEGWERKTRWPSVPKTFCEGDESRPIRFDGAFYYTEITESMRIRMEMQRKQKAIEERLSAAQAKGDFAEMARIQGEYQQMVQEQMKAMQEGAEKARTEPPPRKMTVEVHVNEPRKVIGKKFEIEPFSGTTRSFETVQGQGTEHERVNKILYIGSWKVNDFMKNWELLRPEAPYDEVGAIRLEAAGKRADVESWLATRANIAALKGMTR